MYWKIYLNKKSVNYRSKNIEDHERLFSLSDFSSFSFFRTIDVAIFNFFLCLIMNVLFMVAFFTNAIFVGGMFTKFIFGVAITTNISDGVTLMAAD